ncbi:MAG: EAL domain-containing protein [Candidatus Dormibacteria bacterium]
MTVARPVGFRQAVAAGAQRLRRQHLPFDPYVMSVAGAALYGGGGTLVLLTLAVEPPAAPGRWGVLGVAVAAYLVTALLVLGRTWLPGGVFPYLTGAGSILITLLLWFDGASFSPYALLYIWAALYGFYFYSPIVALVQVLVIALASGVELYLSHHSVPLTRWLMIVGTSLVAGVVIQQLVVSVRALADRDGLTGLPNRRRLEAELAREMARARRARSALSVLMIDLDRFKEFNDEMGHQQGDRHLRETAKQWSAELRDTDLLVRYGGEEFAVILPDTNGQEARVIADRLRGATPHGQTASAGVATWSHGEDMGGLLNRADAALYEAKVAGRDRVAVASSVGSPSIQGDTQGWAHLVPAALASRSVRFAHQPVVELRTRRIVAYEGLARPGSPSSDMNVEGFFAAAQRLGHGRDVDWMCRRACLEQSRALITDELLFINVGVPALLSPLHPPDQMLLLLRSTGWSAQSIVMEITERDLVSDLVRLEDVLAEYRAAGFRFAVDDVGDGHSTLEVLAAASPEYIKVARRLTNNVEHPGARAAVCAVIAFAASLGAQTVAEGIETEEQAQRLSQLGCELGQGWHLGRPTFLEPRRPVFLPASG